MSDLIPLLERALETARHLVAGAPPESWPNPTPCSDWDVGRLIAHYTSGVESFAVVGEGGEMSFDEPGLDPDDAGAAFAAAAAWAYAVWSAPGALDGVYSPPWGETSGENIVRLFLIETVTHGWDLARATGQTPGFDDEVATAALTLARRLTDDTTRSPEFFGPEVPVAPDAPVLDRLAGFLGRTP